MVKTFNFTRTPRIIFGNGTISELPGLVRMFKNEILIITGNSSFVNSKFAEFIFNTFEMSGIRYQHLSIHQEPSPETIDHAVIRYRDIQIDAVIAIGGGSVIDAGKAIAAMLYKSESVVSYLEGVGHLTHPGTTLPLIAVPTTAGTGSECTKNAVISLIGKNGFKRSLRHDNFVPEIAIVDPELTLTCPPKLTASNGMDCFTQLVESYLSTKSTTLTDTIALDGIKSLSGSIVNAWRMGQHLEARASMSYASMLSGICLANAGLGAVHGFASSIGGLFYIPHGEVCGTLMASVNKITVRNIKMNNPNSPVLKKYSRLGQIFSENSMANDTYYVDAFLSKLDELTQVFNLDKLRKYEITREDVELIVNKTDIKTHPVQLSYNELSEILEERI